MEPAVGGELELVWKTVKEFNEKVKSLSLVSVTFIVCV